MPKKLTPLNIKDREVHEMARRLARKTGQSMTEVVRQALRERLEREQRRNPDSLLMEKLLEISDRCARRPVLDPRSDEEIIGYDERGVPR
ncbi:MAG TPA: type II toxin-antitoxin system VapB family antitoxin [Bryobacterales bacterium]|nr:type II toxin-antitoxin system VapB family antitoxin [Bryobacterales bacterium]